MDFLGKSSSQIRRSGLRNQELSRREILEKSRRERQKRLENKKRISASITIQRFWGEKILKLKKKINSFEKWSELIQNIEDEQVDVPVQTPINTPTKKVESEVTFSPSQTLKKRKHKSRNNKLAGLINLEDPIKTGIVFKEIFDKPKSLRRYKT